MVTMQDRLERWADDVRRHGVSEDLRGYLYTRALRVDSLPDQKKIFAAVAKEEAFAPHDRINALTALAWKIIEDGDVARARQLVRRLHFTVPKALALEPSTTAPEDRLHVAVSTLTALWHLQLLSDDLAKLSKSLIQLRDVVERTQTFTPALYHTANNIVRGYMMLFGRALSKSLRGEARRCAVKSLEVLRRGMALSDGNHGKIFFAEFTDLANGVVAMFDVLDPRAPAEETADAAFALVSRYALRVNSPEMLRNLRPYTEFRGADAASAAAPDSD